MKTGLSRGLLLLIVAVIGWFAVVRPQIGVFSTRSLEAKVKQEEVDSYAQRIEDVTFIRDRGDTVQSVLTAQYLAMPKSSQIPEALVMVESLAASHGIVLGSAAIATPTGTELPVNVTFTASLSAVTGFLDALHNNVRTVVVRDQSFTADKGGNLAVTMQLALVYQGGQ